MEANNKQGSKINHSRRRISSPPGARLCLAAPPLCSVTSGAGLEVYYRPVGCCTGWPLSHLVAPEISVTSATMSWCPVEVYGGFVCFSLKADFSRSAATEAGSSNSVVRALLCLVTKALLCWHAAQCPKLRMFSAYLLSFVFELIWHSC